MVGGSLVQIVALGLQNAYLVDNEGGLSYWRQVYHRQTNFAIDTVAQVFQGTPRFGSRLACSVSRNGDLLNGLVLEIVLRRGPGPSFYAAEHLLKYVELEIGGQRLDFVTNTWLRLYDELYRPIDQCEAYKHMVDFGHEPAGCVKRFYVPIPFWFATGDSTAALPLIALQYHDVRLNIELEDAENVPGVDPAFQPECTLHASYVFLDTAERYVFAKSDHEYLIEQTQMLREFVAIADTPKQFLVPLAFNHPVKYLAWVFKPGDASHALFTSNGSAKGLEPRELYGPMAACSMQLNGTDRMETRKGSFFRLFHPWTYFKQAPSVGVYVYSFAHDPARAPPTGSLNFSRVDSAIMRLTTKAAVLTDPLAAQSEDDTMVAARDLTTLEIYARSYNVLRISAGMGGVLFAT